MTDTPVSLIAWTHDDMEDAAEYVGVEPERLEAAIKYMGEKKAYLARMEAKSAQLPKEAVSESKQTLIQCIAESRDALSGILPYIDGSGFSTIYAIKQAKEQIVRCQAAIDSHEVKPNSGEIRLPEKERCIADDQWAIDAFYEGYDKAKTDFKANGFTGLKPIIGGIRSLLAATQQKRESGKQE